MYHYNSLCTLRVKPVSFPSSPQAIQVTLRINLFCVCPKFTLNQTRIFVSVSVPLTQTTELASLIYSSSSVSRRICNTANYIVIISNDSQPPGAGKLASSSPSRSVDVSSYKQRRTHRHADLYRQQRYYC